MRFGLIFVICGVLSSELYSGLLCFIFFDLGQRNKPDIVNEFLDRLEQHMKVEDAVEGLVDFTQTELLTAFLR